jgi:hypothetical protein
MNRYLLLTLTIGFLYLNLRFDKKTSQLSEKIDKINLPNMKNGF